MHQHDICITRTIEFDAGHTVTRHESKCAHLHGHRYKAEIVCSSPELDSVGRTIDFSVVKSVIGGWIDENWDHKFLIFTDDVRREGLELMDPKSIVVVPFNPTAENMVKYLHNLCITLLDEYGVQVDKVRLYETPNGWAESYLVSESEVETEIALVIPRTASPADA